jgi:16S rRNA (adenine1518-N6/adenine1519-N6)-dimethyltransferase
MKWSKRRSFGQHMLKDYRILTKIIDASQISREETVYELGTGTGVLTEELCKYAKIVTSFEVDREIFRKVSSLSYCYPNLKLINADIFKFHHLEFDVFISNIPYSRSKDVLQWLPFQKFKRAVIMTQKEFVDKLQAKPGEKNYRAVTVLSQYYFTIERLFNVSKEAFDPQPPVESTLVRLIPRSVTINKNTIAKLDFLFSQRNKKASSILKRFDTKIRYGDKKIDQLTVKELMEISEE